MITQKTLKKTFHYNPETGEFTRLIAYSNNSKAGEIVGSKSTHGYIEFGIGYRRYKAHRLAFLYMVGYIPDIVDHINMVRDDNRWCNLRSSNKSLNCMNSKKFSTNKSGYKGVCWHKASNRWLAQITVNGKKNYLGVYKNKKDASKAYNEAAKLYFGSHARINNE